MRRGPRFPIAFMCDRLGVSRSGFYDWQARRHHPAARNVADAALTELIVDIHRQSRGTYGSPRVDAELRLGMGVRVGRKRVERLMRRAGVVGITPRRGRRGCTRRNPAAVPSDDLVERRFDPDGPDKLWVADITQHGDALDDAVAESFFASMQTELFDRRDTWDTRAQLASATFEWIEVFCNRQRRHYRQGYLSPLDLEARARHTDLVAAA